MPTQPTTLNWTGNEYQSGMMLCGWGFKAGWLIPFVDKCGWQVK